MYYKFRAIIDWIKEKRFTGDIVLRLHCKDGNVLEIEKYLK